MRSTLLRIVLFLPVLLCACAGASPQPTSTPAPTSTPLPTATLTAQPTLTPTAIPPCEPTTGGELALDKLFDLFQASSTKYPENCTTYCVFLPAGPTPTDLAFNTYEVERTTSDINIYVDRSLAALQAEDGFGQWNSTNYLYSTEWVLINHPEPGAYYLQICNFLEGEANFNLRITLDK